MSIPPVNPPCSDTPHPTWLGAGAGSKPESAGVEPYSTDGTGPGGVTEPEKEQGEQLACCWGGNV